MKKLLYITVFWILFFPLDAFCASIVGIITNVQTGKPLVHAAVTMDNSPLSLVSDSSGVFTIDSLISGSYNLRVTLKGYEVLMVNDVYVSGDATKRVSIELSPKVMVDRVVVRGTAYRRAPDMASSTKVITADELLRAPGAIVDVQRVVQNLPGVASADDKTNEVIVRGGVPGENLFILDNIEIPNPNQFAEQGSGGGVISLVNPLLVKGITFNAGVPPAQYGGKASSLLDVKLRDGNNQMILGGIDVGVAGAGFHAEGPLTKESNFMVSATKSYLDFVAKTRFAPAVAIPEYWGAQARVAHNGAHHKLYFDGILGNSGIVIDSAIDQIGTRGDRIVSGGNVYAAGATWEQYITDKITSIVTLSGTGNTFNRLEYTPDNVPGRVHDTFFSNASNEQEQTLKAQLAMDLPGNQRIIAGGFARRADFTIDIHEKMDTLKQYSDTADHIGALILDQQTGLPVNWQQHALGSDVAFKYAGFVSAIVRPMPRISLIPGLRGDAFTYNKSYTLSPRLGAAWALLSQLELTAAAGIQYQEPDYADLVRSANNRSLKPRRVTTGVGGIEYLFENSGIKCIVEAYYKDIANMPIDATILRDNTGATPQERFEKSNELLAIGKGKSYGFELFAQKKLTKELSWSAAYSYSSTKMQDPRAAHRGEWYRGDYDFGHALTLTGGWKKELMEYAWYKSLRENLWFKILSPVMPVSDRMEFSAKWRYCGARPHTAMVYDETYRRWYVDPNGPLNTTFYEPYHKLDIRWERRFGFGFLQMMYYFDLQNVYNHKNVMTKLYVDGVYPASTVYQLTFFPAGGIIIGF